MPIPSQVANVRWNLNPPPAVGPHAYFDQWAADARCLRAVDLRSQNGLEVIANVNKAYPTAAPGWVYDSDIDAAKGTVLTHYPHDGSIAPQLRIAQPVSSGTIMLVWECFFPPSWADDPVSYVAPDTGTTRPGSSIPSKTFQTASSGWSPGLFVETRLFAVHPTLPNIANIDWRIYNVNNVNVLGPGVSRAKSIPPWTNANPNGNNSDTIQPLLTRYYVQANTWTRLFQQIEFGAASVNGVTYDLWSLWAADHARGVVYLYDRIPLVPQPSVSGFWFEYNESQQRAPGLPAESVFNRNWLMLQNVPSSELLQPPVN